MAFAGIDFGSQNIVASWVAPGVQVPTIVSNDHSHQSTPYEY